MLLKLISEFPEHFFGKGTTPVRWKKIDLSLQTQSDNSTDKLKRDDESDNFVCSVTKVAIAFKVFAFVFCTFNICNEI